MPLTTYPGVRPSRRYIPQPDTFSVGLGIVTACVSAGLLLDTFRGLGTRRQPLPKPNPCWRVSVYDLKTGQVLLMDVPYIREERWENHKYFFKFRDGSERFLDLNGHEYRIVRREA